MFLLYVYEGMADFEVTLLTHLLGGDCGKEICTIADNKDVIKSKGGLQYMPHQLVSEVDIEQVEGLIIPGGWLSELTSDLVELIQELHHQQKLLAAICAAPWILAKSGVLSDHHYTTSVQKWSSEHTKFFGIEDPFDRSLYIEKPVVRDVNIITAKGTAFIDFAVEVCDYLGLFEDEKEKRSFQAELKGSC